MNSFFCIPNILKTQHFLATQYAFANPEAQPETSSTTPPLNLSTHDRNPFTAGATVHVPNYQQTPPELRAAPPAAFITVTEAVNIPTTQPATVVPPSGAGVPTGVATPPENVRNHENSPPIHILPETLVSGAVNVASSAINTARSVINMIVPREVSD